MSYLTTVQSLSGDPEQLEATYRRAVETGEAAAFAEAIETTYTYAGDNVLLAAWHYRLASAAATVNARVIAWRWALPLAALNGLLLWLLSDDRRYSITMTNPLTQNTYTFLPAVLLLAAPISAALIVLFLALAGGRRWGQVIALLAGLAAGAGYVLLLFPQIWPRVFQEQYVGLMVLHLGLLAWAAVGFIALARQRGDQTRFAILAKSLEALIVGGLLAILVGLLTAITFGLFSALGIEPPMWVQRLFVAGGGGLIAVVAVALVYNPNAAPAEQSFDEGLSKVAGLLMRLMLPLSVGVLLVYLAFIPFNWRQPFENRDVLVIFNAMLFAVVALLIGVTPVHGRELGDRGQTWIRRGVIALAALALVVGVYALAAIVYRTVNDRLTPNRLLFIGWNLVNIAILAALLLQQAWARRRRWLPALHRTFTVGIALYLVWSLAGLLAPPWLFRGRPADVAGLPPAIQELVFERSNPILLKCVASPHIYLLEGGKKRWVKDIPTFEAQGYRWSDVATGVLCSDLRAIPDGEPIPPGSGAPPQP